MSQRRDHQTSSPERDMKLNRSPTPPDSPQPESQTSSAATSSSESSTSSEMSVDGSCVSSEAEQDQAMSSPDQTVMNNNRVMSTPMVLAGCPRCLMYVMLSDTNPKCPKCKEHRSPRFRQRRQQQENGDMNLRTYRRQESWLRFRLARRDKFYYLLSED